MAHDDYATWFYYLLLVAESHVRFHLIISLGGVPAFLSGRRRAMGWLSLLAVVSGLTFGVAMFAFAGALAPARVALALILAAFGVTTAIAATEPPWAHGLLAQCEDTDMVVLATLGAVLAGFSYPLIPMDGDTAAFVYVVGVSLYWAPAILIPLRMLSGPPPVLAHT